MPHSLFAELQNLATEQRNPASTYIDLATTQEILEIINTEDHLIPIAVRREIPYIAEAVDRIVTAFKQGGRLFYVGAGTSGRLGILDASECPPTFGTPPELVQGLIAGGPPAVFKAQEGSEDLEENGQRALIEAGVAAEDVVCGIAASRRTPYVVGAVKHARTLGATTLFVTNTPRSEFNLDVDVAICPVVGPEVVMGSTRMKSGTAQKLVLNMLSTAVMIKLGRVQGNRMVDMQLTNEKLVDRGTKMVAGALHIEMPEARKKLLAAGSVRGAIEKG